VDRESAVAILDRLHAAQNVFYGGGEEQKLRALLDPGITWTVPGGSPIAGSYRGIEEVFAYFAKRRDRAAETFRMHRQDALVGEGARIAALTDGTASIAGTEHAWSTVGLYEITKHDRISACWLLPFDQAAFDAIWSSVDVERLQVAMPQAACEIGHGAGTDTLSDSRSTAAVTSPTSRCDQSEIISLRLSIASSASTSACDHPQRP
jgi:ketosteroid isomerase-like protein